MQITTVTAEDNLEEITCTQNQSYPRFLHANSTVPGENECGESHESDVDAPYATPMFGARTEDYDRQKSGRAVIMDASDEDPGYEMVDYSCMLRR